MQINVLHAAAAGRANDRLARYARERFKEYFANMPEAVLLDLVATVRERGNKHRITTERDVATAMDLTVMYGQDFYEAEWAHDVFAIQEWDGEHKMKVLRERVSRQVPEF